MGVDTGGQSAFAVCEEESGEEVGFTCVAANARSSDDLLLLLQGMVIYTDEVADLVGHPKELFPLPSKSDESATRGIRRHEHRDSILI
jgi:hypothetical protein